MKNQIDDDQIVASLLIKAETQGYVVIDDILELLPDIDRPEDLLVWEQFQPQGVHG